MLNTASFSGQKAFITGSGRGIGKALALELATQGADILLHYRKDRGAIDETATEIKKLGQKAWIYQADLCDLEQTHNMLSKIQADHDTLNIYIANAASTAFKGILDLNEGNIAKTFNLVIGSFVTSVQKLVPLLEKGQGQILTISGIDTVKYCPGHGLLAAAKSSLETLSKYLAVELASNNIKVKCLNPGFVASDSTKLYLGENFDQICQQANSIAPNGGVALPEDVAKMAVGLLLPQNHWIGTNVVYADGGLSFLLPNLF